MEELFRRYPEATPAEERKGSSVCVVSHPDAGGPCGQAAVGEVWALPFCEPHGREAELASEAEIHETTRRALVALADAELERGTTRSPVLALLQTLEPPYEADPAAHDAAMLRAYPPDEIAAHTDPETLRFDYGDEYRSGEAGDGPVDWWADSVFLLAGFMREAHGRGVLTDELEYIRERATAQLVLAERDYELRYAKPRNRLDKANAAEENDRPAEAADKVGGRTAPEGGDERSPEEDPGTDELSEINALAETSRILARAVELLSESYPLTDEDLEGNRKIMAAISAAEGDVAAERRRRLQGEDSEPESGEARASA